MFDMYPRVWKVGEDYVRGVISKERVVEIMSVCHFDGLEIVETLARWDKVKQEKTVRESRGLGAL